MSSQKEWEDLQHKCETCRSCPLGETRHKLVFGTGLRTSPILFVGEGPGQQEDLQGEPFVGAAGQLLDEMLSIVDLGRFNCYIANVRAGSLYRLSLRIDPSDPPEDCRMPRQDLRKRAD